MIDENGANQVVTVLRNCSKQLRWAYNDLSQAEAPVGPLTKIDGVATALDGLAGDLEVVFRTTREEVAKANKTVGRLRNKVAEVKAQSEAQGSRGIDRI